MMFKALALVVGAMVSCGVTATAGDKENAKSLDGTWQVVSQWTDGKEDMIAKDAGDMLVVSEGKYTITKSGDKEVCKGTFTFDPTKTPKTIDNMAADGESKGKSCLGIYQITGDEVKICASKPGDTERPAGFEAKCYKVMTLKRIKA